MTFLLTGVARPRQPSGGEYFRAGGLQVMLLQFTLIVPSSLDSLMLFFGRLSASLVWTVLLGMVVVLAPLLSMLGLMSMGRPPESRAVVRLGVATAALSLLLAMGLGALAQRTGDDVGLLLFDVLLPGTAALAFLSLRAGLLGPLVIAVFTVADGDLAPIAFASLVLLVGRLTMWLHQVLREMLVSRHTIAKLTRDEERLRFSRDLHDVVGRDLSAIALKAELALSHGAAQQPLQAVGDIRSTAQRCLMELRDLVVDTRYMDLELELDDSCAVLQASGVFVEVEGSTEELAAAYRPAAAWILREAVTNVLRHAPEASLCDIEVRPHRVSVRNDGVRPTEGLNGGTGLRAMRERAHDVGASLQVDQHDETFSVAVTFPAGDAARAAVPRSLDLVGLPDSASSHISDRQLRLGWLYIRVLLTVLLWTPIVPVLAQSSGALWSVSLGLFASGLAVATATVWWRPRQPQVPLGPSGTAAAVNIGLAVLLAARFDPDSSTPLLSVMVSYLIAAAVLCAGRVSWTAGLVTVLLCACCIWLMPNEIPFGAWAIILLFTLVSTRLAVWVGQLLLALERARRELATLTLEGERGRFSRELSQVVGRRLSQIALKAELVLSEPGDLQTQVPQIRELAQATLRDMRQMVSGYRGQPAS